LNLKVGGEFAQNMYALYDFMHDQLRRANLSKEPEPIATVERLLREIRDAWAQMLNQSSEYAA
jgi:flagellar protein FliS